MKEKILEARIGTALSNNSIGSTELYEVSKTRLRCLGAYFAPMSVTPEPRRRVRRRAVRSPLRTVPAATGQRAADGPGPDSRG